VLLSEDRADEAGDRVFVGGRACDVGTPFGLLVHALE
jgi:hypothetical protein